MVLIFRFLVLNLKEKWKSLSHVQIFENPMDYTVHGILQARLLEWVAFPLLLQGIFPAQGLNPGLPHCRQILYQLSQKGSPRILEWVAYPFSRVSSWPRNWTRVSCIAGRFFTNWAIWEALLIQGIAYKFGSKPVDHRLLGNYKVIYCN